MFNRKVLFASIFCGIALFFSVASAPAAYVNGEGWVSMSDQSADWDIQQDHGGVLLPTAVYVKYHPDPYGEPPYMTFRPYWLLDGVWELITYEQYKTYVYDTTNSAMRLTEFVRTGYRSGNPAAQVFEYNFQVPWQIIDNDLVSPDPTHPDMLPPDPLHPDQCNADSKEPINLISGNMVSETTDAFIPCPGIDLKFSRYYISGQDYTNGPLGHGWVHEYDWRVAETTMVFETSADNITNHNLQVDCGKGRRFMLRRFGTNDVWSAMYDNAWKAEKNANGEYDVNRGQGIHYIFNSNGVLTSISDPWDNVVSLSYSNDLLTRVEHTNGAYFALSYSNDLLSALDTPSTDLSLTYSFSAAGDLTNVTRQVGGVDYPTEYIYQDHMLTQRVNSAGHSFNYAYATNASGEAIATCTNMVLGSNNYQHAVTYYTNDNYTEVSYALRGTNQTYKYYYQPEDQRITKIEGPTGSGASTIFSYDNRDLTQTGTLVTNSTTGDRLEIEMTYGGSRKLASRSVGYNQTAVEKWEFEWDGTYGLPTLVTDPEGHDIGYEYTNNRISTAKVFYSGAAAHETTFGYTADGQLSGVTNANGHWVRYEYDSYGRLSQVDPQAGPVAIFSNNVLGYVESIKLPGQGGDRVTDFTSDALGRVQIVSYPNGLSEHFYRDVLGNITNHVDTAGRSIRYAYAPTRKLTSVTRTLTGSPDRDLTVGFNYDQQFNTLKITDELGRTVESYQLDIQDRPVSVTNVEGQVMQVSYGLGDRVRSVTRFDGSTVSNAYDGGGRLSEVHYSDSTNTMSYYANGLPKAAVNEVGTITNTYNDANRLVTTIGVGPTGRVDYTYWPAGQVSNETSVAGIMAVGYDGAERVSTIELLGDLPDTLSFAYSYNTNNGLVSEVECTNTQVTASYSYNVMAQLTDITWRDATSEILRSFSYGRNSAGMITSVTNEAGEVRLYGYDSLDRLISEDVLSPAGSTNYVASYTYDDVGNRVEKAVGEVTVSYSTNYNRLTGWTVQGAGTAAFMDVQGYSSETIGTNSALGQLFVSNLTAQTPEVSLTNFWRYGLPVGVGTQEFVAAIGDAAGNVGYVTNTVTVTAVTNASYTYNSAGCLTNRAMHGESYSHTLALNWNQQYQITSVYTNGVLAEKYAYNAQGRRAWTSDGSDTNWYVYSGDHVIAETDSSGNLRKSYTWGPGMDNLLAFTDYIGGETNTYQALTDHLGTVHALADEDGEIVESYRFDAWGRVLGVYDADGTQLEESAVGNHYLYQGRWYSWRTGLYYHRARWRDPVTGRFLSKDPIGISGGLNQYTAFDNNPVNFRDPDGRLAWAAIGGYVAYFGGAGAVSGFVGGLIGGRLTEGGCQELGFKHGLTGAIGGFVGGLVSPFSATLGGALGSSITLGLNQWWYDECDGNYLSTAAVGAGFGLTAEFLIVDPSGRLDNPWIVGLGAGAASGLVDAGSSYLLPQ